MQKIKVSIIVPVYNVEQYIEDCLKSIINQTLKEIEIIVINDGSTDGSGEIIQRVANEDERIKYIYRANMGVGPTRNQGIEIARGEYIGFCDADDTIESTMYETMYNAAIDKQSDIVVCNKNVIKDGKIIEGSKKTNETIIITNQEDFFKNYYYTQKYENHVWDKIFKREMIVSNNICFGDLKEITGEDTFFEITAIPYCKKITFLQERLYNYTIRQNSIMNTYNSKKMEKTIRFIKKIEEFENERKLEGYFTFFLSGYIYNLTIASSREAIKNKNYKGMLKDIQEMIANTTINKYAKILQQKKIFKNKTKQYFSKLLGSFIEKKKQYKLYCLLLIKYYL